MAFIRLSAQNSVGTSATTSVSASYPGPTTLGDLLLCSGYTITATSTITPPTGFTAISQDFSSGAQSVHIFWKIADGTETSIGFSATASSNMKIHLAEYTGNSNPILTPPNNGNTSGVTSVTSLGSNSINTVTPGDLVFVAGATGGSSTAQSFSGFTLQQTDASAIRLFDGDFIANTVGSVSTTASWTTSLRGGIVIASFSINVLTNLVSSNFYLRQGFQ